MSLVLVMSMGTVWPAAYDNHTTTTSTTALRVFF